MKRFRKGIIALESWDKQVVEPKAGMKPLLDFLSITNGIQYSYNFLYTPTELEYIIKNIPTKGFSMIYLSLHGNPEQIHTGYNSEFTISINQLGTFMGNRFRGFGLHFASCSVMNSWADTLKEFREKTELAFITGFTKYVEFQNSSLVDHLLISEWIYSRSYRRMFERMTSTHKKLLQQNGFEYII